MATREPIGKVRRRQKGWLIIHDWDWVFEPYKPYEANPSVGMQFSLRRHEPQYQPYWIAFKAGFIDEFEI